MQTIAIYTKDDQGLLAYHGEQQWDSLDQLLRHYSRDDETPQSEALSGWPHARVVWYGDLGIGQ